MSLNLHSSTFALLFNSSTTLLRPWCWSLSLLLMRAVHASELHLPSMGLKAIVNMSMRLSSSLMTVGYDYCRTSVVYLPSSIRLRAKAGSPPSPQLSRAPPPHQVERGPPPVSGITAGLAPGPQMKSICYFAWGCGIACYIGAIQGSQTKGYPRGSPRAVMFAV